MLDSLSVQDGGGSNLWKEAILFPFGLNYAAFILSSLLVRELWIAKYR